jgi:ABC-2 type transport system permease protein
LSSIVMQAPWGNVSLAGALLLLTVFDVVALLSIQRLLRRTLA